MLIIDTPFAGQNVEPRMAERLVAVAEAAKPKPRPKEAGNITIYCHWHNWINRLGIQFLISFAVHYAYISLGSRLV